jgi:uncharacterized protein YbbC (DUF1343 family)
VALFGPEHGFFGRAGAGEELGHERHPAWDIPIYSLYGEHRRPSAEMLEGLDVLVFDLQDLAVRCYTFVSTLRFVMEACARLGKTLIVCDRPIPFPNTVDGPMLDPRFESFVACVNVPLVYGMTSGETARHLAHNLNPNLNLLIARMRGWRRDPERPDGPWISPSPGIRTWETGWVYPVTVFFEAFPSIGCGRGTMEPFQGISAPWIDADRLARELNGRRLPGLAFQPAWNPDPGVRIRVTHPDRLKPCAAAIHMVHALQKLAGAERIWGADDARPEWFDTLMGADAVRLALQAGVQPADIVRSFAGDLKLFRAARGDILLYD